jgi:hypothetical protein
MAGDLGLREVALLDGGPNLAGAAALGPPAGAVIHRYGRVSVMALPKQAGAAAGLRSMAAQDLPPNATLVEKLGLDALLLRDSSAYQAMKRQRPRADQRWDMRECTTAVPTPRLARALGALAAGPTSAYLEGTVAVGIIIVQGPTPELQFSEAERTKVVAEVQNGLGFFATANATAGISFAYDIQDVLLSIPADPAAPDLEAHWRDPAMGAIGFSADWNGVRDYVEDLRSRFGTRWTYCAFFTKYPLTWFAYASIGGPRLVMAYDNDGWGPDNIDRVFAHETGHIFGCPDEYANSGCGCGGEWGRFGIANGNCENCAAGGGVQCLMKGNTFGLCNHTPSHLGWSPQLLVRNLGRDAGGWRVDRHPRLLGDTTGDGRADIVGFGNAGVWVARAEGDGRFATPRLAVANFGYDAGGWRVEKHPRFLADTTGSGRKDIVGFGNAGVYVSRARADGTFADPVLVVNNFGYDAGGWRVEKHPRFLADTTGSGRQDIVGFGNAGVYVSRARADGTFADPVLVVNNFGYDAGGWRVESHPRFLADTTGSGRQDIVGFGNAGVYVSHAQADGTYSDPTLVVNNFGYDAGGWRVEKHPRFLANLTGSGRADIVGFGNAGVYVSHARADGTYSDPTLVVNNFGYDAGGWRVEKHPRLLADITGNGRADIVAFGDAGVWVARALPEGVFDTPNLLIKNFGYDAGGWRVEEHPRLLADVTGGGRADIVGFGNAGAYVFRF